MSWLPDNFNVTDSKVRNTTHCANADLPTYYGQMQTIQDMALKKITMLEKKLAEAQAEE